MIASIFNHTRGCSQVGREVEFRSVRCYPEEMIPTIYRNMMIISATGGFSNGRPTFQPLRDFQYLSKYIYLHSPLRPWVTPRRAFMPPNLTVLVVVVVVVHHRSPFRGERKSSPGSSCQRIYMEISIKLMLPVLFKLNERRREREKKIIQV